jgi:hypothetical protein
MIQVLEVSVSRSRIEVHRHVNSLVVLEMLFPSAMSFDTILFVRSAEAAAEVV